MSPPKPRLLGNRKFKKGVRPKNFRQKKQHVGPPKPSQARRFQIYQKLVELYKHNPMLTLRELRQHIPFSHVQLGNLRNNLLSLRAWWRIVPRPDPARMARLMKLVPDQVLWLGKRLQETHFQVVNPQNASPINMITGEPMQTRDRIIADKIRLPKMTYTKLAGLHGVKPGRIGMILWRAKKKPGMKIRKNPRRTRLQKKDNSEKK